jgi:hypothetical protein
MQNTTQIFLLSYDIWLQRLQVMQQIAQFIFIVCKNPINSCVQLVLQEKLTFITQKVVAHDTYLR